MGDRPNVLDLFSGVGGLGLGFEQAGFDISASIEIDPVHASVHSYNFPKCRTICSDVSKITAEELRAKTRSNIDVVVGGAPCQGFSLIGQRALDDPRNELVKHFFRIVLELSPSYFVLENVKGLTLGKHKSFLDEVSDEFEKHGYDLLKPWEVLNAREYKVPQDRQRLFLIGAKHGLPLPSYPRPYLDNITCEDALGDLPDAEMYDELLQVDEVQAPLPGNLCSYAREMRCLGNDSWHHGYKRKWSEELLTASLRTEHTEISRRRFAETANGRVEPISRFFKLASNGVANTLRAGTDSARGAFTSPRPIHYKYHRCVTVREMARLHGFPDWFRFHRTKWHGARQIGNAVPPPLARAVAEQVMAAMKVEPVYPKETLVLGSEELLNMGMKSASAHWGVSDPIGKRDRKNGTKKRKQTDIEKLRQAASMHV